MSFDCRPRFARRKDVRGGGLAGQPDILNPAFPSPVPAPDKI